MKTRHGGFSLIEVLVALLLTTVGILGMVALQGRSVQYTQDAVQRNVAVDLVNQLVDMIRANPAEVFDRTVPQNAMNSGIKSTSIFFKSKGSGFANTAVCAATAGKPPQTAKEQRDCWASRVQALLPGGAAPFDSEAYICRSSQAGTCDGKGSMLEIRLAWQARQDACPDDSANAPKDRTICTYTIRIQP